jgi:hypothetical protein
MRIKKGFYYKGQLYGWWRKKLYRLPNFRNLKVLPLKELKLQKIGNKKGYLVGGDRKSFAQLEVITTDIDYIYDQKKDENTPF